MARALVLVHSPLPEPGGHYVGTMAPALRELGYTVTVGTLVEGGEPVPEPEQLDALVILGSAESASDDSVPWLSRELTFVRRALEIGTPVLGVCFGGQLLARALGATVGRAPRPERGFVTLGSADPAVLPAGTWMEFHYDAFTLPPGAVALARNDVGVQAFTHGPHLGLQFHPEITPDVFAHWVAAWPSKARAAIEAQLDLAALTAELNARAEASAAACRDLVARFCARQASSPV
ncbi:MAG: type 1 glutamine amidotransferase [Pseudonocardiales bacterium]|nr:type 1 glutamine amidotransferase [Pseudonocardiales bacterium]